MADSPGRRLSDALAAFARQEEIDGYLFRAARSFDVDDDGWHVFVAHPEHFAACPDNLSTLDEET